MKNKALKSRGLLLAAAALAAAGIFASAVWLTSGHIISRAGEKRVSSPGSTQNYYTAADFHLKTVHSTVDFNHDGVDDYTDLLLGARKDAENLPRYDSSYYQGGYPPENRGACTDLVWRAFRNAGYSLKDMVDRDIAENPGAYGISAPDPNIDFRRVKNLKIYLERHAVSLTTSLSKIAEWQPGDIVTFGTNHIGVISDRRDAAGIPFLLHNWGQPVREEDAIRRCGAISGHFRFDASRIPKSELIPF